MTRQRHATAATEPRRNGAPRRRPVPPPDLATCERSVAAFLLAEWPGELTGNLARVVHGAPGCFDAPELGSVVSACRDLADAGTPPCPTTLAPEFGILASTLAAGSPGPGLAEHAAGVVWENALRREAAQVTDEVAADLCRPDEGESRLDVARVRLRGLLQGLDAASRPAGEPPESRGFTIWKPSQFLAWVEPAGTHLLRPAFLSRGELTSIVGQGGLGKSRLALWLAVAQVTGKLWCGLETGGEPARWLFVGNENGISRLRTDLGAMMAGLGERERAVVEEHLFIQAVVTFEDGLVDLGTPDACDRLRATVDSVRPGAVVIDPLANFIPGDLNKPSDMRDGLRLLARTVREVAPDAALIPLHHARTGRQNIAQGVGFDAANFALGAKTLFNACRCVINLMPGAEDDDTQLVLSCAKASNCERFQPRGLRFDRATFAYSVDEFFDLDRWKDDVDGKRTGSACSIADVVGAVRNGLRNAGEITESVAKTTGVTRRTAEKRLKDAVLRGYLQTVARGAYMLGPKASTV